MTLCGLCPADRSQALLGERLKADGEEKSNHGKGRLFKEFCDELVLVAMTDFAVVASCDHLSASVLKDAMLDFARELERHKPLGRPSCSTYRTLLSQ